MTEETNKQISWFQTERDNVTRMHRHAMQEKQNVQTQKKTIDGDIFKERLYQQQINFLTLQVADFETTDQELSQRIDNLKRKMNSYVNMYQENRREIDILRQSSEF
jgi:hypothetical protein